MLGIERPLFQGGMAWIADAKLAAAVSNAGGLGLISSINFGTEAVREEIRKCKTLTDKPFGVNIMLQAPNAGEVADMIIEEGVKIVTTGAGSPAAYMEKWKAAGIKVIPVVASVAYALKMQELGATAVVAEGAESGGHIGDIHTMALVPQVVDALDIPVLAAGGIFDGRGVAAAFMLGAKGVQGRDEVPHRRRVPYSRELQGQTDRRVRCQHNGDRQVTRRRCPWPQDPVREEILQDGI